MPRISLKSMFVLVALAAVFCVPLSFLVRHSVTWGPAERTENMLGELYCDASEAGAADITIEEINVLLETPKFEFLKRHRVHDAVLRNDELAWFSPNSKYTIGLNRDGSKLWIVDGRRTDE